MYITTPIKLVAGDATGTIPNGQIFLTQSAVSTGEYFALLEEVYLQGYRIVKLKEIKHFSRFEEWSGMLQR